MPGIDHSKLPFDLRDQQPGSDGTLFNPVQIDCGISMLAHQISRSSPDLTIIALLKGGAFFATDLARALWVHGVTVGIDFLWLSSYAGQEQGEIFVHSTPTKSLKNKDLLVVDDVLDSGRSLKLAVDILRTGYQPKTIRTAVLLEKPMSVRKVPELVPHYVVARIPDVWVAGYGMDDADGGGRAVPYVYVPRKKEQS